MNSGTDPTAFLMRISGVFEAVKFRESIFALPFAYSGMVLAAGGFPTWGQFVWITVAMVSARTLGMAANRIIDRNIDARNPRTANRHLPRGDLHVLHLVVLAIGSLGLLSLAASQLNTLAFLLVPIAAAYLIIYPYTKRFTWTANLLLGWALAMAPSAAWIGVRGMLSWEPVLFSCAVAFWAGSFDIIYHSQDWEFYTSHGLRSVAQRFGIPAAFKWARLLDGLAVSCLILMGRWMDLAFPYFAGCIMVAGLLVYKYIIVSPNDLSRLNMAFFRINALVSSVIFVATITAVLMD